MKETFYSNGKLLLTGEYVVLDGAKALALPTKYGQHLQVEQNTSGTIKWTSFDHDGSIWFETTYEIAELRTKPLSEGTIRNTLHTILYEANLLNPDFFTETGFTIETHLTFPRFWGLGTSSTLINNIATWMRINAFDLLRNSFGGSGYDIACAKTNTPLVYQLQNGVPTYAPVAFAPVFHGHLYFVYLNRKQSSKAAIAAYYNKSNDGLLKKIAAIDDMTAKILEATNAGVFSRMLHQHEVLLSDILEMETVQEALFADFKGVIKSLGGWGGDFILAVSQENPTDYFKLRGFDAVIPYHEMIL